MTTEATLDANLTASNPAEPPTKRDEQRSALKDLVDLCADCAATEAEIDRRRQTELDSAKKQMDKASVQIEQRYQGDLQAIQQKTTEASGQLNSKFQSAAATIATAQENARRRIDSDYDPVARKLQAKIDHDVWLAESVFEVSQNQVRAEIKKARDENEKYIADLDEMEVRAKGLLSKYHQSPAKPAAAAIPAPADAAVAVDQSRIASQSNLDTLRKLFAPGLFVGSIPYLALAVLGAAGGVGGWLIGDNPPLYVTAGAGVGLVVGFVLGVVVWIMAKKQVEEAYHAFCGSIEAGRQASALKLEQTTKAQEKLYQQASEKKKAEILHAKEAIAPLKVKALEKRDAAVGRSSEPGHPETDAHGRRAAQAARNH